MVISALFGAAFALIADRLSHWFFAVATLAFAAMTNGLVAGLDSLGGATGLYGIPLVIGLKETVVSLVLTLVFVIWLDSTRLGRAMRAVRDSDLAAQAQGINPMHMRVVAFALGTGLAGLAGGLWRTRSASSSPRTCRSSARCCI